MCRLCVTEYMYVPVTRYSVHALISCYSVHLQTTCYTVYAPISCYSAHLPITYYSVHLPITCYSAHLPMTCYSVHLPMTCYSVHASGWLHQAGRRLPQPSDLPCCGGGLQTQVDLHTPASQRTTAYCQIAKDNANREDHNYALCLSLNTHLPL